MPFSPMTFLRALCLIAATALAFSASARPATSKPTPLVPDLLADRIFAHARDAWQARAEAPFLMYGIRLRITKGSRQWDNWWEAFYRNSDQKFVTHRIALQQDEERRLKGVPLRLQAFGLKIFDTNPDAEPIVVEEPSIQASESFGILRAKAAAGFGLVDSGETPEATPTEIGRVQAVSRDYAVQLVNDDEGADDGLYHLKLTPQRDPQRLRLRELWVAKTDYVTSKLVVDGISDGEPYDRARWVASYTQVRGRVYLQQLKNEAPLHFGLTTLQGMEIDFIDYHFPASIPHYEFVKMTFGKH
jgi:hypothetical protein